MLFFLLGAMSFSLSPMLMGMGMSGGETDCPFMSPEEVICPMNLIDHIGAWKSAFVALAPTLGLLIVTAVFVVSIAPNLIRKFFYALPPSLRFCERIDAFSRRPLQELFSSGILNPKLH